MFRAAHPHSPLTCPAPLQCRLQRGLHKSSQAPGQSLYSQTFHKAEPYLTGSSPPPTKSTICHTPARRGCFLTLLTHCPLSSMTFPALCHTIPARARHWTQVPPSLPPTAHPIHALLPGRMVRSIPLLNRKVLRDRAASATFVSPPVPVPGPERAFDEHWINRFQTCLWPYFTALLHGLV